MLGACIPRGQPCNAAFLEAVCIPLTHGAEATRAVDQLGRLHRLLVGAGMTLFAGGQLIAGGQLLAYCRQVPFKRRAACGVRRCQAQRLTVVRECTR